MIKHDCKCYGILYVNQSDELRNKNSKSSPFVVVVTHDVFFCPQKSQNMFQEGLHQVFFKARPLPHPVPADDSTAGELMEDRLVRWFGTVVNTRLLLSGVTKSSLTVIDTQQFNEYICSQVSFTFSFRFDQG